MNLNLFPEVHILSYIKSSVAFCYAITEIIHRYQMSISSLKVAFIIILGSWTSKSRHWGNLLMSNDISFVPNSFMNFFCGEDRNLGHLAAIKMGRENQDAAGSHFQNYEDTVPPFTFSLWKYPLSSFRGPSFHMSTYRFKKCF